MVKDPVCNMNVDEKSAHKSTHEGQAYVFCSATCKTKFDKEPGRYLASAGKKVGKECSCCA